MPPTSLDRVQLLEGASYTLVNVSRLLRDAVLLFRNTRTSSATVLAVFAREELGKHWILRAEIEALPPGHRMPLATLKRKFRDHVGKLHWGQTILTMELPMRRQGVGYDAYRKELDQLFRKGHKQAPHEAHEARIHALYVEPDETGAWNQPYRANRTKTNRLLRDVLSDYQNAFRRFCAEPAHRAVLARHGGTGQLHSPGRLLYFLENAETVGPRGA